jgi:hypothetical protein
MKIDGMALCEREARGERAIFASPSTFAAGPGSLGGVAWPVSVLDQLRMRPGEGGGRNRVAAQLVFQPGRGVTSRRSPAPGRLDEARLAFEKMLTYANHLGLYAEQISRAGEQQGNFPQALTHLALISAAFNLDRALGA